MNETTDVTRERGLGILAASPLCDVSRRNLHEGPFQRMLY